MGTVPEEQHLPCPFCGSDELSIVLWADDDGEFDALECDHCKAAAPLPTWDQRATDRAVTAIRTELFMNDLSGEELAAGFL